MDMDIGNYKIGGFIPFDSLNVNDLHINDYYLNLHQGIKVGLLPAKTDRYNYFLVNNGENNQVALITYLDMNSLSPELQFRAMDDQYRTFDYQYQNCLLILDALKKNKPLGRLVDLFPSNLKKTKINIENTQLKINELKEKLDFIKQYPACFKITGNDDGHIYFNFKSFEQGMAILAICDHFEDLMDYAENNDDCLVGYVN